MKKISLSLIPAVLFLFIASTPLPAVTFILDNNAGWSESIKVTYDRVSDVHVGSPELRAPHQNIAPVASYGHSGDDSAENVNRSVHVFNSPRVIVNDYPSFFVLSATLYVSLDYGWCSWNGYQNMPGVEAYYIDMVAPNDDLTDNIDPNDFWSPALMDLGFVVPAGGTLDGDGILQFDPNSVQAEYAVDVTDALQDAVASSLAYLPIRLQLGGETDGKTLDANLNIDYVFRHASNGGSLNPPRLEVILSDIDNCSQVHQAGFGYIGDLDGDCRVTLFDFALFVESWGLCNDPALISTDPGCAVNW